MMQQIAVPQSSAVEELRVKIRSFLGLLPLQQLFSREADLKLKLRNLELPTSS